jgi:lipopolysaccharide transport system ATP-binding protein
VPNLRKAIDPRNAMIDRSQLRNDLRIFPFDPAQAGFGSGSARVIDVVICNEHGEVVQQVLGGQRVVLEISLQVEATVDQLIVGFLVKDRLGQWLFGDNTYLSYPQGFGAGEGEQLLARFQFVMPRLYNGDYFVAVGLAEGTQQDHVVQHWLHEALRFGASGGTLSSGLMGIPMEQVSLERTDG